MGAEPGRRFLKQPAAKLEPVTVEAKSMSLSGAGPHIEWHINEGRTLNGLLWSYQIILA